jgi:hypothetical protein
MEDDFHHFSVKLQHDGTHIRSIDAHSHRFPWSTCPGAGPALESLIGLALNTSPLELRRQIDVSMLCTHQLDLSMLAAGHAARQIPHCQYDVEVVVEGATKRATLRRDGEKLFAWIVNGLDIVAPEPYAGKDLKAVLAWALRRGSAPEIEAIMVMRRAVAVSRGRTVSLDRLSTAAQMLDTMAGACHTFQPATASVATRMMGTTREFDTTPEALLR